MSYLLTTAGVEIDLVIERPGKSTLLVEIKAGQKVLLSELNNLIGISREMDNAEAICLYNGEDSLKYDGVEVLPWRRGIIERIFSEP
jgi:hypothetical protein